MRFYEHETKALFARHGLPLGKSGLARSREEARQAAASIGGPVVLKSQVLSGGRMKAGAIQFADAPDQVPALFERILATPVKGLLPESVLVEAKSTVEKEYYAGVTWDGRRKLPVLIFSDHGRDRHRGGRREAPGARREAPPLDAARPDAAPRESIEVRALVLFPAGAKR